MNETTKTDIPIGFLTVPFGALTLKEVARFGGNNGFEYLEVAAWPSRTSREAGEAAYVANHLGDLDNFSRTRANYINETIQVAGMKGISSLAYYENMLSVDAEEQSFYQAHLKKVIDAAQMLGVQLVGTFPGRDQDMTEDQNLREYGIIFPNLVKYASDHGVQIMFENCPMEGWIEGKRIGSIAYCPKTWRAILEMTPEVGLNMDPSHLMWQGIDYERAVREFGKYIVHAHAKDVKLADKYETGTIGENRPESGWGLGLYEHRIPGQGDVNWEKFINALREVDYKGVLSVELEAPQYRPRENVELSKLGIATARQNLLPYCKAA